MPPAAARIFCPIEVAGLDRACTDGPTLFAVNHVNSLIDPMLWLAVLPRRVRFLATGTRSDAWH